MENTTKEDFLMAKNMALVFTRGKMVPLMKVGTLMIKNTVMVNLLQGTTKDLKGNGLMEKEKEEGY